MSSNTKREFVCKDFTPEKVSISNARKNLSKMVHFLESEPKKIFELDRRDTPSALLLSFDKFSPLVSAFESGNLKTLLATFVIKKWLGSENIPPHLSEPQLKELETMELLQLLKLFQADPSTPIKSLMETGNLDEGLVTRLIKRHKITEALAEAEESDLYDVSEHLSGAH